MDLFKITTLGNDNLDLVLSEPIPYKIICGTKQFLFVALGCRARGDDSEKVLQELKNKIAKKFRSLKGDDDKHNLSAFIRYA